ncbi:DUF2142 domain-containing protein [Acidiphilium iwatense]|nr:DUF2142 domain-containing protein [Acidiphilium iwatense]
MDLSLHRRVSGSATAYPGRFLRLLLDTRWLPILFLACALPTGIRLALLTPMGQVADEPAHIARADGLLYGQILGFREHFPDSIRHGTFPVSGVNANLAIIAESVAELPSGPARPLTQKRVRQANAIKWSKQTGFDICPNTVQYFPFFYLPGTIGIGAAPPPPHHPAELPSWVMIMPAMIRTTPTQNDGRTCSPKTKIDRKGTSPTPTAT